MRAEHSAVYYRPDPERWFGLELRPARQRWCGAEDAFDEAAAQLAHAGLDVRAWVVLAHNSRLATAFPGCAVRNAYGDTYGWALCIANPRVRRYAAELAAEAAARPGVSGIDIESCGWYGYAHLHAHDKTGGVPFRDAGQYLMSLCFCDHCRQGYREVGLEPDRLAETVRNALEPIWRGAGGDGDDWDAVRELLGADVAEATLRFRSSAALRLQRETVAAVRQATEPGFTIRLHADPLPYRTGANVGVDATTVDFVDGLVVPPEAVVAAAKSTARVIANVRILSATEVADTIDAALAAGARELSLYHAGLASDQDLGRMRRVLRSLMP
ncbi:hypothetical protein [Catenulispora subtropica]|uniref:hypothetical protein n=1 Tax=Catenulispora subtropica TaxID=450798 RepID=UPI0031CFF895